MRTQNYQKSYTKSEKKLILCRQKEEKALWKTKETPTD
jgi:hypothetical protein